MRSACLWGTSRGSECVEAGKHDIVLSILDGLGDIRRRGIGAGNISHHQLINTPTLQLPSSSLIRFFSLVLLAFCYPFNTFVPSHLSRSHPNNLSTCTSLSKSLSLRPWRPALPLTVLSPRSRAPTELLCLVLLSRTALLVTALPSKRLLILWLDFHTDEISAAADRKPTQPSSGTATSPAERQLPSVALRAMAQLMRLS